MFLHSRIDSACSLETGPSSIKLALEAPGRRHAQRTGEGWELSSSIRFFHRPVGGALIAKRAYSWLALHAASLLKDG